MNKSKIKGTRFESEVVTYLHEHGFPLVERRALQGNQDKGDIAGVPNWTLECKSEARINLASYVDEARTEGQNAKTPWYAAVVKRRGKNASQAYVVMPLDKFVELITSGQV